MLAHLLTIEAQKLVRRTRRQVLAILTMLPAFGPLVFAQPPLSLSGEASQNTDSRMNLEFHVQLNVHAETAPFSFHAVHVQFEKKGGEPVGWTTTSQSSDQMRIDTGGNKSFSFGTNGYTGQLLKGDVGSEVTFKIYFLNERREPILAFVARIPPLKTLPDRNDALFAKREGRKPRIVKLQFRPLSRETEQQ